MIENIRKYPVRAVVILAVYYGVGVIGLNMHKTQSLFMALVPFTLLCSLYFLWLFDEVLKVHIYLAALSIYIIGFAVEVAGVNTGIIFGEYEYGQTLGIKLWNTPLMIGVNWLLLIYSGWALTGLFFSNRWVRYTVGAVLMVAYDIALEPVAIRLDMWDWPGGDVPVQNYIAWFFISFILFLICDMFVKQVRNKIAPALFIIQFVFFVLLNLIFRIA